MATLLETEAVLKRGLEALAKADPVMARLAAEGVVPRLRKRPPGFEGLAWIIVFYLSNQQWPVPALGNWNILVGFGIMFIGFLMTTRWR